MNKPVKEKILDAAVGLLRAHGAKKLAQIPIAKAAGVPQGHLTYYFPRRTDLLSAIARRFVETVSRELLGFLAREDDIADLAQAIVSDRENTRMLVALFVESEDDPRLREQLQESADQLRSGIAHALGKKTPDDPGVVLVQACLWGLSLQHLVYQKRTPAQTRVYVDRLARWLKKVKP